MWLSHTESVWNTYHSFQEGQDHESGQGLIEYALILILVGVAVTAILVTLGPAMGNVYQNVLDAIRNTLE